MKLPWYAAALCLVAVHAAAAPAPAPKATNNKEKIVGVWKLVKAMAKEANLLGTTVEFTKAGTVKVSVKGGVKNIELTATYSVDGNKLTTKMKGPDGKEHSETDTITKLTDTELHLKDSEGKRVEFKRKKGK